MATQQRLNLTRDQLATFLKDFEQIKQFEKLFATVDAIAPDFVNEVFTLAANADAKAIQALGQIAEFAQAAAVCCAVADRKATEALDALTALRQEGATANAAADNRALQALQTATEAQQTAQATAMEVAAVSARATQALDDLARLSDTVALLATAPPPREFKRARWGSFYDTTTQTAGAVNTAKEITFNTTDLSSGVRIGTTTSHVIVDQEGIYNFQTSIQLDSTVATDEEFYLWFRLNGVDVTNSASQVRVKGNNDEVFLALNYFFSLKPNDYVELVFSVTNLGVRLLASGAVAPHPGIPSVILTVSNNIQGVQ